MWKYYEHTWICPTFPQQTPKECESLILRYLKLWYQIGTCMLWVKNSGKYSNMCLYHTRKRPSLAWMRNLLSKLNTKLCYSSTYVTLSRHQVKMCPLMQWRKWKLLLMLHVSYSERSMLTLLDTHFLWSLLGMPYGHCFCSSNTSSGYTSWPSKTALWV